MNVAVLVPVLGRPDRVEPLVESIQAARGSHNVHTLFLVSYADDAQWAACREVCNGPLGRNGDVDAFMVHWPAGCGDYAMKMNAGARMAVERGFGDWLFLGADDLRFHPGWLDAAERCHSETSACVVGTNDLGNPAVLHNEHSTHTLVSTRYLECGTIDGTAVLLHEGYDHSFVDNELVGTAIFRETYAQALDCVVEHLHPNWRKGTGDATYNKGQRAFDSDRALFRARAHLWGNA